MTKFILKYFLKHLALYFIVDAKKDKNILEPYRIILENLSYVFPVSKEWLVKEFNKNIR